MENLNDEKEDLNGSTIHLIRDELVNIIELCQIVKHSTDKTEFDQYIDLLVEAAYNTIKKCNTIQDLQVYEAP